MFWVWLTKVPPEAQVPKSSNRDLGRDLGHDLGVIWATVNVPIVNRAARTCVTLLIPVCRIWYSTLWLLLPDVFDNLYLEISRVRYSKFCTLLNANC